ncbi:hypothetical protein PLUTE_b0498 [Pseudoalteromonas luteoviolacea DSM 6061]|nr:hypothetical protein [Pseudoalteromonas luteoviolacea DSM 6061]
MPIPLMCDFSNLGHLCLKSMYLLPLLKFHFVGNLQFM